MHSARLAALLLGLACVDRAVASIEPALARCVRESEQAPPATPPKLPKSMSRALADMRSAEPAAFPKSLPAVLEAEWQATYEFRSRVCDPSTRNDALAEIEAADPPLATTIRAALPAGKVDESTAARVLAPWFDVWIARPCTRDIQLEITNLVNGCKEAQRSILAAVPNDTPDNWKKRDDAAAAWDRARA